VAHPHGFAGLLLDDVLSRPMRNEFRPAEEVRWLAAFLTRLGEAVAFVTGFCNGYNLGGRAEGPLWSGEND
jgi:hypothetical protein